MVKTPKYPHEWRNYPWVSSFRTVFENPHFSRSVNWSQTNSQPILQNHNKIAAAKRVKWLEAICRLLNQLAGFLPTSRLFPISKLMGKTIVFAIDNWFTGLIWLVNWFVVSKFPPLNIGNSSIWAPNHEPLESLYIPLHFQQYSIAKFNNDIIQYNLHQNF